MTLQRMALLAAGGGDYVPSDPDAAAYVALVDAADGQILETAVKIAINDFVIGCKTDGIWSAIKACCLLMGARTLAGALVPLVGPAPTNNNFVSGDYSRKTGLVGNATNKFLDTNRAANADPQNNNHFSVHVSTAGGNDNPYISTVVSGSSLSDILRYTSTQFIIRNNNAGDITGAGGNNKPEANSIGVIGSSRNSSTSYSIRYNQATVSVTNTIVSTSNAPGSGTWRLFRYMATSTYSNARISFYSIGESLNLALLDARITTLVNALAAAIP